MSIMLIIKYMIVLYTVCFTNYICKQTVNETTYRFTGTTICPGTSESSYTINLARST